MKKMILLVLVALVINACKNDSLMKQSEKIYVPDTPKLKSDIMTPEVLWSFGRIGNTTVSPDGKMVLFSNTYYSEKENKPFRELYTVPVKGGKVSQLTHSATNESTALWRPDGQRIGFICNRSGSAQLWEMKVDGSNQKQVSFVDGGISGFKYAPDLKHIFYTKAVKLDPNIQDRFPDLPKANARLENDLMYRHWDQWHDYTYSHIFVAAYMDGKVGEGKDIMEGEKYNSPDKPFDGLEQIVWSPDGTQIVYSCKKLTGKAYALSTNTDLYCYDLKSGKTKNLTLSHKGYDKEPAFSPDGHYLAWTSMEHAGYESDQARLLMLDLKTGKETNYSGNWEQNAGQLSWSKDSKKIYFISDIHAVDEIYALDPATGEISRITDGNHDYETVQEAAPGKLVAQKMSISHPSDIYLVDEKTGKDQPVTQVNKGIMDQLTMGKVESRWMETVDHKKMQTWVIYPPHFDPHKKYPAILYCQGGPQETVSQFWSYRWNFQMMAADGYIVVAPNRRGLPGFGLEWLKEISKNYGGLDMQDYLTAIDQVAKEPYVDADHLGCVGASYGGFSVNYLAGHNENKRFKAFISHCGIFNLEQMYVTTEEMWFENWDIGGPYWDKNNAVAQRSYSFSPHLFVDKWNTPILLITGGKDFRIPFTQNMGAYNAAKLRGIPAEFLYFPDESHWVTKPQDGILWQRVFKQWLDKWLKK